MSISQYSEGKEMEMSIGEGANMGRLFKLVKSWEEVASINSFN